MCILEWKTMKFSTFQVILGLKLASQFVKSMVAILLQLWGRDDIYIYTSYIYHIYYVCIYILCVLNILCLSIEILCICIHIIHVNCLAGCCSFIVWQATWLDAVFTAFIGGFFASTAFLAPRVSMLRPRSSGSLGRSGGSKDNCQMLPGLWRYLSICKIYKCNIYPAWN